MRVLRWTQDPPGLCPPDPQLPKEDTFFLCTAPDCPVFNDHSLRPEGAHHTEMQGVWELREWTYA